MTTEQRQALVFIGHETEAMGLQIFNLDTECVETWNGVTWIQQCYNNTPTLPPVPLSTAATCGITPSVGNSQTFTAKADPYATKYEFFVGGDSKGKQSGNVLELPTLTDASQITVAYYYHPSFLKPTMLPITGNVKKDESNGTWYYGDGTPTTVSIPDFKMSETTVTQAQYESIMGGNPSIFKCGSDYVSCRPTSALPVEGVNWYAAITYCNKLSLIEHKTPCYSISGVDSLNLSGGGADGHGWRNIKYDDAVFMTYSTNSVWNAATCNFAADGYRLPTEWEWEYAARGGVANTHKVFSGSAYTHTSSFSDNQEAKDSLNLVGWNTNNNNSSGGCVVDNYYGTKAVKTKRGNIFGLYGMSGNVYEWCWNWYADNGGTPFGTPTDTRAYVTTTDNVRVQRGGYWNDSATNCRVSSRINRYPYLRGNAYGFRVVCK
jgi:formylglycine-generating enzyme required for sulfatase activity